MPDRVWPPTWRSASIGNLGGWQVARCLWPLNVLTGRRYRGHQRKQLEQVCAEAIQDATGWYGME